ncbi:MAG: AraC family transcriptional regulator [Streptomycetaceae bacterium]|nr:AraC family transcriptional regulator [Streptomycetaceae bacterium]
MQLAVGEYLAPYRLRVPGGEPFSGSLAATRSGDVVVASVRCDVPVQADIDAMPDSAYHITLAPHGSCRVLADDGPVEWGSHVVGAGQRVRVLWPADAPVTVVRLSRRLVERVWRDQGGRPLTKPLRFTVPLSPLAVHTRVWETFATAFVASRDCGLLAGPASAGTRFGQLLAQALLNLQPHARPQPVPPRPLPAPQRAGTADDNGVLAVPAPVLRALEFCREHAHEQLAVADIAGAAGMSVRRLQAAFRTHLGTTPVEYIKQVRLAGVHADLQRIAAGASHETVTDVALRWGFTHLGRFSGTYRAEFGRLPSQTARSAPPGAG